MLQSLEKAHAFTVTEVLGVPYLLCRFIVTLTDASAYDKSSGELVSSCPGTSSASSTINAEAKKSFGFSAPVLSFLHIPFTS